VIFVAGISHLITRALNPAPMAFESDDGEHSELFDSKESKPDLQYDSCTQG